VSIVIPIAAAIDPANKLFMKGLHIAIVHDQRLAPRENAVPPDMQRAKPSLMSEAHFKYAQSFPSASIDLHQSKKENAGPRLWRMTSHSL
jgi:hypothetical protein